MIKLWRFLMAALWVFAAAVFVIAPARADVGGQVPGPGLCDYPGVGNSGLDGVGVYHYWCAFPTEINGSHWQCIYGGAAALGSVGASFLFLNASISSEIGVLQGVCYWACPDLSVSDVPNPPGAWKNYITPTRCRTIAPAPMPLTQEPSPDDAPPPPPLAPANNDLHATGAPTNPDIPNPDATQNPQH